MHESHTKSNLGLVLPWPMAFHLNMQAMRISSLPPPAHGAEMQPMPTRPASHPPRILPALARAAGIALLTTALYGGFRAWLTPDNLLAWLAALSFCG